jgi:uncharacterized integral membrane protein (TIGR00698 family)
MAKNLFFIGVILAASGLLSPSFALAAGLAYGLSIAHPFHAESKRLSHFLLQASVVCLGFGINLHEVLKAGRAGFVYTAISISLALLLGWLLGRTLKVGRTQSFLISAGTAICGGSAIAALGPVSDANEEEMAVSMGTVFVLNSVALFLFPLVGWHFRLDQTQFGLWSALAIHDTSSVVGAAARYGAVALAIGTSVKLARALWIVPISLATAATRKSQKSIRLPWFILYFCMASVISTCAGAFHTVSLQLSGLGRTGLTVTLFLIGSGLSRPMLRKVGVRPMLQGVALWMVVAVASLAAIRAGWVHL